MSHAKNKVEWCLRKAEKELNKSNTHKGLVKIAPNKTERFQYHKVNLTIIWKIIKIS